MNMRRGIDIEPKTFGHWAGMATTASGAHNELASTARTTGSGENAISATGLDGSLPEAAGERCQQVVEKHIKTRDLILS